MKTLLIVLMLMIVIGLSADWKEDLNKEGINKRLILHGLAGGALYAGVFTGAANVTFMQEYAEEWSFYISSLIIVGEDLNSNNWKGIKFYKVTSSFLCMSGMMKLLDGKRPIIYASYDPKTKAVGIDFAFAFDLVNNQED